MLSLLEISLAVFGVRPVLYKDDPYVGFTAQIPLFDRQLGDDGAQVMATAPNKLRWFNAQSFPPKKPAGTCRIFCIGGSTTYGRPYDDTTSFCGWLRELLPRADSSKKWELINAGGISYASYRVAKVAEELIQYEPDLFIVYSGQNEFLEGRTYENLIRTPSAVRELGALVSHTRTYAAIQGAYRRIAGSSPHTRSDPAMLGPEVTTILGESVGPKDYHRDDAFQQQVLEHYRYNLTRIVDIARSAGADVVFVAPASNLLDCAPFKSEHRDDLSAAELERWTELYDRAQAATDASRWRDAAALFEQASAIDDGYAQLHYLHGRALYQLARYEEAKQALVRARDEDICPLRALEPMRGIVAQVAAGRHVPVVDFASFVEDRSPHGIPGENLFLDHVHPTIEGNRLLALEIVDAMARSGRVEPGGSWNGGAIEEVTAEVESHLDRQAHARALRNLAKVLAWAGKRDEARKLVEEAATMIPDDAVAHFQMGVCAQREADLAKAARCYRLAIDAEPSYAAAYNNLGQVLELQGNLQEATDSYARALMLNGDDDKALFNMGKALLKQGQAEPAAENFRRVVDLRPLDAEAHVLLASALVRLGRSTDALEAMETATELRPRDPDTHNKLGSLLAAKGDYSSAQASYRRALGLDASHAGAMENLAWLLATAREAACRNGEEAVRLALKACEANGYEDPASIEVLAAAQAEAGQFEEACATARCALELATAHGQLGLATTIGERLELYEKGRPCRD